MNAKNIINTVKIPSNAIIIAMIPKVLLVFKFLILIITDMAPIIMVINVKNIKPPILRLIQENPKNL